MASTYRFVMRTTGTGAAIIAAGWTVAVLMTHSDGEQLAREVNSAAVMLIVSLSLVAADAWIVERSHRIAAERHTRPLVRQELDRALAECMPLFVATVLEGMTKKAAETAEANASRVDRQLHDLAVDAARQTAARIREAHTADLEEISSALHRKTLIAGMQLQANATGEQVGKTALRSVKTYVGTSKGD